MVLKNFIDDEIKNDFDSVFEESMESKISENGYDSDEECLDCTKNVEIPYSNERNPSNIDFFTNTLGEKFFEKKSLEEKMNDIYEEFKADTTITLANIKDIAFRTAAIKGRWCSRFMAEKVRGINLKRSLDSLIDELGKIADKKLDSAAYLVAKQSRENIINSNEEVKRIRSEIYESKLLQEYLSRINDSVKDLGYIVKNSIDALNLERGI